MNLVVLNGRLVRDPELKFGQSGKAYSRFSIAVDRQFSGDKTNQSADFINCVAFGKTAEFIGEYFRKGRKILLNGKLQMNQYESEGKKLTTYVVVVDSVEFGEAKQNSSDNLSSGNNSYVNEPSPTPSFEEDSNNEIEDDGFPF